MTASQYHSSDVPFLGAFFVAEILESGAEYRVSKYFSHYIMADEFMFDVQDEEPEAEFEILFVDSEETLQYILSVENEQEGENNGF